MNIKEFSTRIGVSPTTTSSAITGNGRISKATRQMVLQKMRELGYTPNLNARRLVSGRSYMVALSHVDQKAASDLFTMQVARAIVGPLKEFGYDLWLNLAPDSMQEYSLLRQLVKSSTIDGTIIISDWSVPKKLLRDVASRNQPCVVIGEKLIDDIPFVGSVMLNLKPGALEVARLFAAQGHKRIGFIDSDLRDRVFEYFADALKKLGTPINKKHYVAAGRDTEEGARALRRLMSQPNPPTAIFARTDVLAIGAIREARNMGLSIPQNLSVVGHDDLSILPLAEPGLTTVRIDCTELAKAAAEMLSGLLRNPDTDPEPKVISTSLVMRQTAAPTPRAAD
mgnify:CR=1 FL=1